MHKRNRSIDAITVRHFWRIGASFKKDLLLSLLIPVNALLLYTITPFIVGKILANLIQPTFNLTPYIVGFAVISSIAYVLNRISYAAFLTWQPKVMSRLQAESLDFLVKRGISFHNNSVAGKLVSDAVDYPNAYQQLSNNLFVNIIPFLVTVIGGLALITFSSPILGLLMLCMSGLAIASGIWQRKKMQPFREARIASNKAVISHLADTIVNIHAVKTFAHEKDEMLVHKNLGKDLLGRRIHDWKLVAVDGSNRIGSLLAFEFLFILLVVWLVRRDPTLLSIGIFAFSYTISLTNKLFDIGTMVRTIEEALTLAEPITSAMQHADEVVDAPKAFSLPKVSGEIEFQNVRFQYSDSRSETNVFEGLNLSIKTGEKIGLVGPSGGGKSTITKLLLRFEDIQDGVIMMDKHDISKVTQMSLRQNISYVPQESLLFHRSIADNIRYGNLLAPDVDVVQAAKSAYAHDFIMGLPDKYDTIVGERGVKLSGGQRQRIAIARAMLKNAQILVLDEATSALDSESEQVIQHALDELMKGRTALVIAHRLSTIQRMDRIVVLDNGKLIESGTHAELLANKGMYADLWARQSGGFMEA